MKTPSPSSTTPPSVAAISSARSRSAVRSSFTDAVFKVTLPGERSGVSRASFQHHIPDGIEGRSAAPGELPDTPLIIPGLGNPPVEIELDNVQSSLRKDQESIVGTTPRRCFHSRSGCVGAGVERHAMTVSATVAAGRAASVSDDVEHSEAVFRTLRQFVRVGTPLGRRERDTEQVRRQIISLGCRESSWLAFIVDRFIAVCPENLSHADVDQMPRARQLIVGIGGRFDGCVDVRTVIPTVRIAEDSVPMERRGVAQTTHRHRGTGHDLIAAGDDRSLQHPQQLVGVVVRVATFTGKRAGR